MPTKRAKKSKIPKPRKRRAPAKKSTKSIYQKVNVNVQSGGGGGGSGGMSQPSAQHHPIPQYSQIPNRFYDKTGENVKLNNIIELLNKQEKKVNQMHTNDPFDYEYGRIPDYSNSSNSSVSSLPFYDDSISSITNSIIPDQSVEYNDKPENIINFAKKKKDLAEKLVENIERNKMGVEDFPVENTNPILNLPPDTSNQSLLSKVVDNVKPANNERENTLLEDRERNQMEMEDFPAEEGIQNQIVNLPEVKINEPYLQQILTKAKLREDINLFGIDNDTLTKMLRLKLKTDHSYTNATRAELKQLKDYILETMQQAYNL